MKFIDEAQIEIIGGHGGAGSVHFRRETMEPWGGPDGGDGGKGGSVYIKGDTNLATLMDFRFKKKYQAPPGVDGGGKKKAGKDGEDIILRVPIGTIVKNTISGEVMAEILENGQQILIAGGGRGGKGNSHFATSTHQAPKFAQPGEPGQEKTISLELKLLADVGLLGFPNVGKSSLIAAVSAARPKIADYAFTTLVPNLGVVRLDANRSFVIADVPGLIEGAHEGVGLGIRFLKHLERTKVYLHIIDAAAAGRDPEQDYEIVRKELASFNPEMLRRPEIIVFNKMDSAQEDLEGLEKFCARLDKEKRIYRKVSVATTEGIKELVQLMADVLYTNKYDFLQ